MNKIYKNIFNAARGCVVAVSEATSSVGQGNAKKKVVSAVLSALLLMSGEMVCATDTTIQEGEDVEYVGGSEEKSYGFNNIEGDIFKNLGNVTVTGGKGRWAYGFYNDELSQVLNHATLVITGGRGDHAYGFVNVNLFNNLGSMTTHGNSGNGNYSYGFYNQGEFTNSNILTATGGKCFAGVGFENDEQGKFFNLGTVEAIGTGDEVYTEGFVNSGEFSNVGIVIAKGGTSGEEYTGQGFSNSNRGTFVNEVQGVLKAFGGSSNQSAGFSNFGSFYNYGKIESTGGSVSSSWGWFACGFKNSKSFTNFGAVNVTGGMDSTAHGFYNESDFINKIEGVVNIVGSEDSSASGFDNKGKIYNSGLIIVNGGRYAKSYGFRNDSGTFINEKDGILKIFGASTSDSDGFWNLNNGKFTNQGTLLALGGGSSSISYVHGFLNFKGTFINESGATIKAEGGSGLGSNGFWHTNLSTFSNFGTIEAIGGSYAAASGFDSTGAFINEESGVIKATGSGSAVGFTISADLTNLGTIEAVGKNAFVGMQLSNSTLTNHGLVVAKGADNATARGFYSYKGTFINYNKVKAVGGENQKSYGFNNYNGATFINKQGGILDATGGSGYNAYGLWNYGTFTNESGGILNVKGGSGAYAYGILNSDPALFTNIGTINLIATSAKNAFKGKITQSEESATISGNLLSFAYYTEVEQNDRATPVNFIDVNNNQLVDASTFLVKIEGGVKSTADFLSSNITGGTINITDTDWSEEAQLAIKKAIYESGVTSNVNITFGGIGNKSFGMSSKKVIDVLHAREFIAAGFEGSVLYEDVLDFVYRGLTIGGESADLGSLGFKSVASNAVTITDGKALTLLGDGTQLAGTAGQVSVSDGELKLGFVHDVTQDTTQGGELSAVTLADAGKLSVADVNGTYRISDNLSLADKATLTNAGKLSVATIAFAGNNATVTNTGVSVVQAVSGSGKGNTLKNAGVYSQTDLSAFGDIQNKGTLKTDKLFISATDKIVNGGMILAKSMKVDGKLQNRNGTFALGTAAVAQYLKKHLDLAQQLKDLGETLPASVEKLLTSQTSMSESASAPVVSEDATTSTTEATTDSEVFRDLEKNDGIDFASWLAAMQAANAPQGRLATREGRIAFAGLSTFADNQAQLERLLQSGVSGLWADVIASQSEMDDYKANRSGIAVGLQGTNDAGLTFGVAARYSDGKLKGDTLASENWTSAGGSAYAAWDNDDAFVSGFIGYDNLKTKGSDKLTNDVVSAGVKSGLKLDVGPVHVTPFVGGEVVRQKVKGLDVATTYRFPMGVGLSGQYETYGAWQVHPSLEVAFVPQAGDKVIDVTDKVDSRFAGNYAVESRLGIVVEKKNLMLGINYHGSAGDAGLRSHSLQANVKYRF